MLAALIVLLVMKSMPACADQTIVVDSFVLQQMQETIRRQQQLLHEQDQQIRRQADLLDTLQMQVDVLQQPAASSPAPSAIAASPPTITSGNDRVKLAISGQVNRAVNIVSDGRPTRLYHVDNNATNSRIRFIGSARINEDLQVGTRIEVAITPDNSSLVSQTNQTPGDYFNERWTEISLRSKTFGTLTFGKGDTASKGSSYQDISRTDVVQYVGVMDIAAGMFFRKAGAGHDLSALRVSDAFRHRDGLGRLSRLRYDTPSLLGFTLSGALVSDQRSDLGLYWGGQGYGLQAIGALAVANPKLATDNGLLYDGSLSMLHVASGLNLTLSGGLQKHAVAKDSINLYAKLGWIANLTTRGYTAFGLDYTYSGNTPSSNDRGYSVGAAVVQTFEKIATELYLQYRIYSLKPGNGPLLDDLQVTTIGARVKF